MLGGHDFKLKQQEFTCECIRTDVLCCENISRVATEMCSHEDFMSNVGLRACFHSNRYAYQTLLRHRWGGHASRSFPLLCDESQKQSQLRLVLESVPYAL